jgi:hypothetical protein
MCQVQRHQLSFQVFFHSIMFCFALICFVLPCSILFCFVLFYFVLLCFSSKFRIISAGVDGCFMLPHVLGVRTCNYIILIISSWYGPHDYNVHVHILDLIFNIQLQMALADVDGCFMHSHVLGVHICISIIYFPSIRVPIHFLTDF